MSTTGTKEFNPSPFQQAIFDHIADPAKGNLVVEAVAGSGKTTTIIQATKFIPPGKRGLYVAFNKRNIDDLKAKLPSNIDAATLNSVGHRAWGRFIKNFDFELTSDKTYRLIDEIFPNRELTPEVSQALVSNYREVWGEDDNFKKYIKSLGDDMSSAADDLHKLVALAKSNGLVPNYSLAKRNFLSLTQDTRENWLRLINDQDLDIDRPDVAIELARRVLARGIEISDKVLDFDDQLLMTVICRVKLPQYPFVFVDEAQDLVLIQHALVRASVQYPGGRVVAVGDRRQAIYGWRGALTNSMDVIKRDFNAEELPLSISYRCGKEIVKAAQEIVPHIQPHPDRHDGHVETLETYGPSVFGPKDAVICRNTRPLVSLAYQLIRCGVSCRVLGKDIEHNLVKLIHKTKAKTIDELESSLSTLVARETEKFKKKGQNERAQSLIDRAETVKVFAEELPENSRTIKKLIASINRLFRMDELRDRQMLILSTGHKSKGGEWDTVFFLDPHLIPSKYSKTPEAITQCMNVKYVIITRAIKRLFFIRSDGFSAELKKAA